MLGLALACVAWVGVLLQLWLSLRLAAANGKSMLAGLVAYLGYFTVLTNLLVALVLTAHGLGASGRAGRLLRHPQVLACAAVSITLVGLGYHLLLRHVWDPQGLQWVADVLLHYIVPMLFVLYWIFELPKRPLPWWSPLAWAIYPLAYVAYAFLRGEALGTYPYPFIDVGVLGYARSLRNAFSLWLGYVFAGALYLALARAAGRSRRAA